MRHALVSMIAIAAAVVSAPALAQEAGPPAVEPTVPAAPAPETPAPAVAATPAAPAAPAVVAITETEPEPEPVQLPPTPNDPMTLRVLQVLDSVCKPLVQGGDLEQLAEPLRFRERRGLYTLKVDRYESISLRPSATNDNVCFVEVDHAIGGDKNITIGLHNWAVSRGYKLYRNDEFTTDLKRHTRSWELNEEGRQAALVFVTSRNPDGSSIERRADRSTIMYTIQ